MKYSNEHVRKRIKDSFIAEYTNTPLHKISVKKICESAKIPRTSFYTYYADVYEVLEEIENEIITHLKKINTSFENTDFRGLYSNTTVAYFDETLTYVKDNRDYLQALIGQQGDNQFIYKRKKIIKEDFGAKYTKEQIYLKNKDLVLELIASGAIGVYTYWLFHMEDISKKDIAEEALDRLCRDFLK